MVGLFRALMLLTLLATGVQAAPVEEQRKYNFDQLERFQKTSLQLESFHWHQHTTYSTQDIYLDSADYLLLKEGFSFRLRRVQKSPGVFEYAVQLKSEMEKVGDARMELEHKDLSLQQVAGEPLIQIIDHFIDTKQNREANAKKLRAWIERKMTSTLTPFAFLRFKKWNAVHFAPVLLGMSERLRFHVFSNKTERPGLLRSGYNKEKPPFFIEHPQEIWLMEASLDQARFFAFQNDSDLKSPFVIKELEVENKYRPRALGTPFMSELEGLMLKNWQAQVGKDSKYVQSMKHFKMGLQHR